MANARSAPKPKTAPKLDFGGLATKADQIELRSFYR
jgi:hypothetical protein